MYFMSNICFLSVHTSLHVCTSVNEYAGQTTTVVDVRIVNKVLQAVV